MKKRETARYTQQLKIQTARPVQLDENFARSIVFEGPFSTPICRLHRQFIPLLSLVQGRERWTPSSCSFLCFHSDKTLIFILKRTLWKYAFSRWPNHKAFRFAFPFWMWWYSDFARQKTYSTSYIGAQSLHMMARNRRLMKNRSLVRFHYYDHWIHKHCLQISLPSITWPNGYINIMVTVKLNVATDNSKLFLWLLYVDKDRKIKFVRFQWYIVIPDWIDRYNVTCVKPVECVVVVVVVCCLFHLIPVVALLTCCKISNSFPLSILWSTPGGGGGTPIHEGEVARCTF